MDTGFAVQQISRRLGPGGSRKNFITRVIQFDHSIDGGIRQQHEMIDKTVVYTCCIVRSSPIRI